LVQDKRTRPLISKLVVAIRDGAIPVQARQWLLASWLVPLDKGEGKARPVAGGTALFKLAATYLMENVPNAARDIFRDSGVQYGLFMKGGTTAAAHMTQLKLDSDPSHIVIKVDFANAFNTIPRRFIFQQLYRRPELTSLYYLAHWAYHSPSPLLLRDSQGQVAAILESAEGVRQGCVLGSLLFGVATLDLLHRLKERFPDIETTAFLDDVSLSGNQKSAFEAFDFLQREASVMGVRVQKRKCEVLISDVGDAAQKEQLHQLVEKHGLRLQRGAVPFLGTVVGHDRQAIKQLVTEKVDRWKKALDLLAREEIPTQLALLVARWNITSKPNTLARSLPPNIITDALADYDQAVVRTVEQRLKLSFVGEERQLLQLPIRSGGVGFCPNAETTPFTFVAGLATSCQAFGNTNLCGQNQGQGLGMVAGMVEREGTLLHNLHNILCRYFNEEKREEERPQPQQQQRHKKKVKQEEWPEQKGLRDVNTFIMHFGTGSQRQRVERLQARLVGRFRERQLTELKKTLSAKTISRMESRADKTSALVWKAFPLTADFTLSDEDMRFTVAYATGLHLPDMPRQCGCATGPELDMEHTVHCAEKLTRHNMIQDRLVTFARLHGVTTRQNPRYALQDQRTRVEPDIVFYPVPHAALQTDVTVINPCAPSRLQRSTQAHQWASKEQKSRKNRRYLDNAKQQGQRFEPLVFETHGKMADEVKELLDTLASRTPTHKGLAVRDMQLDLAITLARGNALMAKTTVARAQRYRDIARARHPVGSGEPSSSGGSRRRRSSSGSGGISSSSNSSSSSSNSNSSSSSSNSSSSSSNSSSSSCAPAL
jgi:hypothetical protein